MKTRPPARKRWNAIAAGMTVGCVAVLAGCGGSNDAAPAAPAPQASAESLCNGFLGRVFESAVVTSAALVPAAANVPEHCLVRGEMPQALAFEMRLPTTWNKRTVFLGGGGFDGSTTPPGPFSPANGVLASIRCNPARRAAHARRFLSATGSHEFPERLDIRRLQDRAPCRHRPHPLIHRPLETLGLVGRKVAQVERRAGGHHVHAMTARAEAGVQLPPFRCRGLWIFRLRCQWRQRQRHPSRDQPQALAIGLASPMAGWAQPSPGGARKSQSRSANVHNDDPGTTLVNSGSPASAA